MNHDDVRSPGDVKWRHAGQGLSQSFRCAECDRFKGMFGRRLKRVTKGASRGLRALVCAECAK